MNLKLSLLVLPMLFIAQTLSAQESRKTVILYNVVPLTVEVLKDGTIKQIYGKADHYFKGYQLLRRDNYLSEDDNPNFAYSELGDNLIVSTNYTELGFNDQVAVLNKATIAELDRIKNVLFQDPSKKVILTSYHVDKDLKRAVILLQNRLKACLSYLDIMGVSKDRIILDSKTQVNSSNAILATEVMNAPNQED